MSTRAEKHAPYKRSYAELINFAWRMRRNPTAAEAALWRLINGKQLGVRSRRQTLIVGFIVDFYIPKWRLAIELDGEGHRFTGPYDARRDAAISAFGVRVIRFSNQRVFDDPAAVVAAIVSARRPGPAGRPGSSDPAAIRGSRPKAPG